MKVIGVIPARWGSTRLEGKVLSVINGKPMIQHVWERAKQAKGLDDLLIACDDERIVSCAKSFKAKVVLTAVDHLSGTDRIAEAVRDLDVEIVVNIQGDEPLIEPSVINGLAEALKKDRHCLMATVIKAITTPADHHNSNVVKIVIDQKGFALYFSRAAIPFVRGSEGERDSAVRYKHLGLYAYRKDFLLKFTKLPKSTLEVSEQLEQLRVLEAGYRIQTIKTDVETVSVDVAEDLAKVEAILKRENSG